MFDLFNNYNTNISNSRDIKKYLGNFFQKKMGPLGPIFSVIKNQTLIE